MPDFVFLHGGGQGGWVWSETIAAMQAQSGGKAHCLALDVPGCGAKRGRDTSGMTLATVARELLDDVKASGMQKPILVGHSQAGSLLPVMVEQDPGLFSRLVYVSCIAADPGLTIIEMTGTKMRGAAVHPLLDESLTMEQRYALMFCNDMSAQETADFVAKLGKDNWPASSYSESTWSYDHLAGTPTTYMLCLADAILPLEWQERFAGRFYAEHLVRIDAGHQVMNTRPQALAEVLLAEALG
jgi:pimeloyl-ACP methyl ester carboxylesterase